VPERLNAFPIDLILLVRGGGSLEDLWAFNEEVVARAICASRIPIATGIGHEPDTTIADLVGDLRGATPTAVTELTIPDVRTLLAEIDSRVVLLTRDIRRLAETSRAQLDQRAHLLRSATREAFGQRTTILDRLARQIERIEPRHAIAQGWRRVEESQRHLADALRNRLRRQTESLNRFNARMAANSPAPRIERLRDQLTGLERRLIAAQRLRLATASQKLAALATQLRVVSPQAVLDRGFSITTAPDGSIVRTVAQVKKGDVLQTRVADGTITSTVGKPKQASLF
jgi:exodeoxyribonuclease VII large subunit